MTEENALNQKMKKVLTVVLTIVVAVLVILALGERLMNAGQPGETASSGSGSQSVSASAQPSESASESGSESASESAAESLPRDGSYTSPEDVALYLHTYGELPGNFLTKSEAEKKGWVADKGNLWEVTDHMSIGGDRFGNREGVLPDADGRKWYECDVNYQGGFRGAERLLYSSDGLIYYSGDHYKTASRLY